MMRMRLPRPGSPPARMVALTRRIASLWKACASSQRSSPSRNSRKVRGDIQSSEIMERPLSSSKPWQWSRSGWVSPNTDRYGVPLSVGRIGMSSSMTGQAGVGAILRLGHVAKIKLKVNRICHANGRAVARADGPEDEALIRWFDCHAPQSLKSFLKSNMLGRKIGPTPHVGFVGLISRARSAGSFCAGRGDAPWMTLGGERGH